MACQSGTFVNCTLVFKSLEGDCGRDGVRRFRPFKKKINTRNCSFKKNKSFFHYSVSKAANWIILDILN